MEYATNAAFFATACAVAIGLLPFIIKVASLKGFWEVNDERKTHTEQVSSLGGIAVFIGAALSVLFLMPSGAQSPAMVFGLGLPLLLVGVIDDLYGIGVTIRLVVQATLGIVLFEMGFQIADFGGHWLLNLSATTAFVMLLINAYNFIDGINGLSGSLGLVGSLFFAYLLMAHGEAEMAWACCAYAGGMAGFLFFNFGKKAQIFLGDNGSTVLGLFTAIMCMSVLKHGTTTADGQAALPILVAIISLPVIDLFKVTALRVLRGHSPFHPDRTHIHHLMVDGLLPHPIASAVLAGWLLAFGLLTFSFPVVFNFVNVLAALAMPYALAFGIRRAKKINFSKKISGVWAFCLRSLSAASV